MVEQAKRLTAQRMLFAAPLSQAPDELYARTTEGAIARARTEVTVSPRTVLSTNTFFGRFPASYWQHWTRVHEVRLHLTCAGQGELRLVASDSEARPRVVDVASVGEDALEVELVAQLDRFVDGGGLWLEAATLDATLTISDARWTVPAPNSVRPTAVVMPTFNRVDYCLTTLKTLARDMESLDLLDAVYVIDQGSDTVDSRPEFAAITESLRGKLHYIQQPNLGGAAGYGRGLYEVTEVQGQEHANALFMDDDIWLEPDVVVRLSAFANHTAKPAIIGGQMLRLLHPDRLHVGAETANIDQLTPGVVAANSLADASMVAADRNPLDETGIQFEAPQQQERRVEAGYNGWWSCLIPSEVARTTGYPLPVFFQGDDVEYAYRARANGFPTITLPGAGVWHVDFDWKDWDDWHRYFNIRNAMITSALHGRFETRRIGLSMLEEFARYLVCMQYGLAATMLKSVEDFLRGPEFLHDGGAQAAADIRKLRAEFPETVRHPCADVPGIDFGMAPLTVSPPAPTIKRLVFAQRLLWQLAGRTGGTVSIAAGEAHWWHVSRFDTAVVTDASQEGVRVRTMDQAKLRGLAAQGLKLFTRFVREGAAVGERYRRALPELTSRENWARLYAGK
ncbi:MAG TPA: glycosyltransferase [Pseudonocardiaceae bacterium]|jgi:galactofuranosylgalactofuranosylrhamnosyl-N-acetylglucosaminyl-diphospho-decaprenol beta-1,5/1,6-galactofuranosyltransferase|nr:glycosyltransferase [Pseudonocardiaceae bacterium]